MAPCKDLGWEIALTSQSSQGSERTTEKISEEEFQPHLLGSYKDIWQQAPLPQGG